MKRFLKSSMVVLVFLGILLACAGRADFREAWIYTAVSLISNAVMQFVLRDNSELARERSRSGQGAQRWDKVILGVGFLLTIATLVVAGLDTGRFHPVQEQSGNWSIAGVALMLIGSGIFLLAMKENRFFSAVVRIQSERNHTVCSSGPYRLVRHPGYVGMIIGTMGIPFVFLSVWSVLPAGLSVILLMVRTTLEDRHLSNHLTGYQEYRQKTRWRLLPGIW